MNNCRTISLTLLVLVFGSSSLAEQKDRKGPEISDKVFRQSSALFLDDPLNKSAPDWARLILLYSQQTSSAAVVFGREELSWSGLDRDHPRSLLLLAAYSAGNIQSQLNSGVKRNDRYSGLLTLFRVYRALREQNEQFRISSVDDLLALHEEGKLVPRLQNLEAKKPVKLTPAEEEAIHKLMRTR
jgi:hypothetical protein